MPKYRIMSGSYSRFENGARVSYRKGDDVELTPEQAAPRKYQIRLLSEVEAEAQAAAPKAAPEAVEPKAKDWTELLAETAVEVGIEVGRMESVGDLESLRDAEEEGASRRTVLKSISNRIEALTDEDL